MKWAEWFFPHYLTAKPSEMQKYLADLVSRRSYEVGKRDVIVGPRGGAKSTWLTLIGVLFGAVTEQKRYIWIVSDTAPQAQQHLDNVRQEVESNARLMQAYPLVMSHAKCTAGRILLGNGVTIEAMSTGQKVRGRRRKEARPDWIIIDDGESDDDALSPNRRQKNWKWFTKALLRAGGLKTNVTVIGSALHRECLTLRAGKLPNFDAATFRAILKWPERMDLWSRWEEIYLDTDGEQNSEALAESFYRQHQEEMNLGAVVNWPDYHDLYRLMQERASYGHSSFECEMQANPINPDNCEWPEDYLDSSRIYFEEWPKEIGLKVIALDPSKGKDAKRGDYSAFVLVALGLDGIIYVDANLERRTTSKIVSDGVTLCRQFQPHAFSVEANVYQELLADEFLRQSQIANVAMPIWCINNHVNKLVRLRTLTPILAQRRLRFRKGSIGAALLVDQMRDFPIGDHDDGPDALEMAVRMLALLDQGNPVDSGIVPHEIE